jgi:hypothetical protein
MKEFEQEKTKEMIEECEMAIKEMLIEKLCHCHLMLETSCEPDDMVTKSYWRGARDTIKHLLLRA